MDSVSPTDADFMRRTIELALEARGRAWPNPMVGAVLVRDGRIIAEGFHHSPGKPHAEVEAIKNVSGPTKGATLYVNLEPCSHSGRTGPCTDAIIKAGISEVVIAIVDPNPLVNGGGISALEKAGITVRTGILEEDAALLNDAYLGYHRNKRPFVTVKMAQSLDGRIATATGDSQWISSEDSREIVHRLRSEVDAVMVGAGTVRKDNPRLTVREAKGKNPFRIIITESGQLPDDSYLLSDNDDNKTIIATTEKNCDRFPEFSKDDKKNCWAIEAGKLNSGFDLHYLMEKANSFGIKSILVEGGAGLVTSLLKNKLVDKIIFFIAPVIIGDGISSIGDLKISSIDKALKIEHGHFVPSGPDICFVGYPVRKN